MLLQHDTPFQNDLAIPISNISRNAFETNYYLIRGQTYNLANTGAVLQEDTRPIPEACQENTSCAVPPGEFCRGKKCPPLSFPTREGCIGPGVSN